MNLPIPSEVLISALRLVLFSEGTFVFFSKNFGRCVAEVASRVFLVSLCWNFPPTSPFVVLASKTVLHEIVAPLWLLVAHRLVQQKPGVREPA